MITEFSKIAIGATFFDGESGEYFEKLSETTAKFISGGDYYEGQTDIFFPESLVTACHS